MNDEFNKLPTPENDSVNSENIPADENATEETPPVPEKSAQEPVETAENAENQITEETTSEETVEPETAQLQPPAANAPQSPYANNRSAYYNYTQYGTKTPYRPINVNPAQAQQSQQTAQKIEKPKKKRTGLKVFAVIMAIILAFSFGVVTTSLLGNFTKNPIGGFGNNTYYPDDNSDSTDETFATDNDGAPDLDIKDSPVTPDAPSPDGTLTTAQIAAKVKPSIVGIVVYTKNTNNSVGEGTGVVMGEDSSKQYTYIITCAHVISDSGINVRVQTEDGTAYDAQIVGIDTRTDLGVLKIKATGLTPAEFGNSDSLKVGDSVYAIGNPGGVEFFGSFTGGFVSAIDRPVNSEIGYTMKCIQHDAAINPGNSGGALVNVYGQVIGINSQKIAATDYEGMGFAIPITSAKTVVEALINYNYVPNRPKLGITYYPVSASTQYSMIAQIKGLPAGTLIIDTISEDSSLANTEVRQYDMITAVDGKPLTTADILLEKIDNGKVGDKMTLTICRVNNDYSINEFDVEITLVEDKGSSTQSSQAPQNSIDPFEYFENF